VIAFIIYKGDKTMLRLAQINEILILNQLIEQSVRRLCKNDYAPDAIESAIHYVFGVDTTLVEDKTYYVIEDEGVIQACGGWSKRKTLFGGNQFNARDSSYLDPTSDAAKIRAFFVHPDHARKGLGSQLLNHCEQQALAHGFAETEMMATLSGLKLYQARGYLACCEEELLLPDGMNLKFVRMNKRLSTIHNAAHSGIGLFSQPQLTTARQSETYPNDAKSTNAFGFK
jgi:GNAT superfamily N-acetyltransferase